MSDSPRAPAFRAAPEWQASRNSSFLPGRSNSTSRDVVARHRRRRDVVRVHVVGQEPELALGVRRAVAGREHDGEVVGGRLLTQPGEAALDRGRGRLPVDQDLDHHVLVELALLRLQRLGEPQRVLRRIGEVVGLGLVMRHPDQQGVERRLEDGLVRDRIGTGRRRSLELDLGRVAGLPVRIGHEADHRIVVGHGQRDGRAAIRARGGRRMRGRGPGPGSWRRR